VSAFIDAHRERFGVEPICRTLDVSASAYYQRASGPRCARVVEDERLLADPRAARRQLLRLRLPADVEGAHARPRNRCRAAGCSG
jgi:putative transposase